MLKNKQGGFTLLELLVVITLLAVLSVGALVAYDGIGENAESTAAAYNAASLDRAVRNYRAVENEYPNQWDNLAHPTLAGQAAGSNASDFIAPATKAVFGSWNVAAATSAVNAAFFDIVNDIWVTDEIQHVTSVDPTVAPGKMHNEGSNPTGAIETDFAAASGFNYLSIAPSYNGAGAACTVGGQDVSNTFATPGPVAGADGIAMAQRLNAMNDAMGIERCHLVIALGFGGDAASSTSRSSASIVAAPTYSGPEINPSVNYARYVGLFHVGRTASGVGNTNVDESMFFSRPKLIGFVDTVGNPIEVNIANSRSN